MRLAADLGGTNARFALGDVDHRIDLAAADHPTLDEAVAAALARYGADAHELDAVFAVAAPVEDGHAVFTNLRWTVDARAIARSFGFASVRILNDVEAAARAAARALPRDIAVVHAAPHDPHERHALISVGTGLGVAYWRGGEVDASEAGHMTFAPTDEWTAELARCIAREFGRASWERVVSGAGLARIDGSLRGARPTEAAVVVARAASGDEAARDAVRRFSRLLGRYAGDLALGAPATGGILLAGGVLAHLGAALATSEFVAGFTDKGRFSDRIARVPVWRTADDTLALRGALA